MGRGNSALPPDLARIATNPVPTGSPANAITTDSADRFAKILRFGRTRNTIGIDVYNVTNSAAILTYNQNYNPTGNWLVPTSVLQPRFVKISAQIDF